MAPLERRGQEKYETLWDEIRRSGFVRMRVDGKSYNVEEPPAIDHRRKHQVEVVVDRVVVRAQPARRASPTPWRRPWTWAAACCTSPTSTTAEPEPDWHVERFSQHFACDRCGRSFEPLNPHHFSFNSPLGWCPTCEGLGVQQGANPAAADPRSAALAARRGPRRLAGPDRRTTRSCASPRRWLGTSASRWTRRSSELDAGPAARILHGTGEAWIAAGADAPQGNAGQADRQVTGCASSTRACSPPSTRRRASAPSIASGSTTWSAKSPARPAAARGCATTPAAVPLPRTAPTRRTVRSCRSARRWRCSRT